MSQVIGPDISFYQDEPTTPQGVDFAKMRTVSDFVILRAGQNLWVDSRFKTYWGEATKAGLPRGSYWFFDSRADPKRQAELWAQTLGSDLGELPLFADFEERYGGAYKGWQNWYVFLERLKTLVGSKEIGIYTAPSYWRENAPNATAQKANLEYFHKYPLWIAHYLVEKPLIPKPWGENEWLLWQYTAKGDGKLYGVESLQIDLNHFNGSPEAFRTRFNLPEPIPLPAEEFHYRVDLSVRASPAESSNSLGNLNQAEVVTGLGTSEDKSWMQIRRENGLTGWVNSNAFVRIPTPVPTPDPNPNPNPNPNPDPNPNSNPDAEPGTGKTYRVTINSLRIRSGPGASFEVVGALSKDELVEEINANNDKSWLKVRRKDGLTGWSASEFLSTNLTPPAPRPQPEPLKVTLFPGVTYVRDVRQIPRMLVIHVLAIDVTTPGLELLVTPPSGKIGDPLCARTTSKFLSEFAVQIAVNGDGFTYPNPNSFNCPTGQPPVLLNGFAASRGQVYSTAGKETTFFVGRLNKLSITAAPGAIFQAVSGDRPLVSLGRPVDGLDTSLLNPRTALGITKDGRLILMVVDGRQAGYSEGVNFVELAALLIYYGVQTGMNLDGGGSSTMVVEGPDKKPVVLNSPIDSNIIGQERAVANHLGIFIRK